MPLTSALLVTLALAAAPERVLLCRPAVDGDAGLARAEARVEAGRALPDRYLDYGVPCLSLGEAARAAGRAGLDHAVQASAAGQAEGARFTLVLTTAREEEVARRALLLAPGEEADAPLREALRDLERQVPRPPPRWPTVAAWGLGGAGLAALAVGAALTLKARSDARRVDAAATPADWQRAHDAWSRDRRQAAGLLMAGGASVAAGLTLRLAF